MGVWTKEHWTKEDYQSLERAVREMADGAYRAFSAKLIPGETREIWGVRVPQLRAVAREIARGNVEEFLGVSGGESHEMVTLEGMVITGSKLSAEEKERRYAAFSEKITNWAICDVAVGREKDAHRFDAVAAYTKSEKPFVIRFGLVRLLASYVNEEYIDRVLEVAGSVANPHYYVRMAVAWLLSVCYVHFPEKTAPVLGTLDAGTQKMAKQKIRDSYRVPEAAKNAL